MTSAPGTKKKTAARTHKLMEEVPLCPAAAIQRGPRTVAMLKSSTSQKPIALRSWDLVPTASGADVVIESPGAEQGGICSGDDRRCRRSLAPIPPPLVRASGRVSRILRLLPFQAA